LGTVEDGKLVKGEPVVNYQCTIADRCEDKINFSRSTEIWDMSGENADRGEERRGEDRIGEERGVKGRG
jgi:hypothetical protein